MDAISMATDWAPSIVPTIDSAVPRSTWIRNEPRVAERMTNPPSVLDESRRATVLFAVREVCTHRNWNLLAAHVRTTHVHMVVDAEDRPERVLNDVKARATHRLNSLELGLPSRKRWARHGSTRWLWKVEAVAAAINYVVDGQGLPMAVFCGPGWGRLLTRAVP